MANGFATIEWRGDAIRLIDQTLLPAEYRLIDIRTIPEMCEAIRVLRVRGAPAIGCAAAYALALLANQSRNLDVREAVARLEIAGGDLAATRPTAVNLFWAIDDIMGVVRSRQWTSAAELADALVAEAQAVFDDDDRACRAMGAYGAALLPDPCNVLTHCNAGGLATSGYGTAIGVIRAAHEAGKRIHTWVDETRPLLQGARLTAWELQQLGIPATLICDNMAGHVMSLGKVDAVVVGADRIAANGDTANKIGTQSVAVLAQYHGVPFYVAAPVSTIDRAISSGEQIPIEQRDLTEITSPRRVRFTPDLTGSLGAYNPAFDVTPAHLVGGIITERGVLRPPYAKAIAELFA